MSNKKREDIKVLVEMVLKLSKGEKGIDVDELVGIMKKHNLNIGENGELVDKKK